MRLRHLVPAGLACSALLGAVAPAQAQIARVFVSVNGNDANFCENISTPCRTFAAGINRVDANGEVIVLDSGSYGGTTITKAVRINVPLGLVAFAAQPFVINAPGAAVALRGLTLKALTFGSGTAITYTAASYLHVENCVIDGWSVGVNIVGTGEFFMKDTTIRHSSNAGLVFDPPSAALAGAVENSRIEGGFNGLYVNAGKLTLRNVLIAGNSNIGAGTEGFAAFAELNADKCIITNNGSLGFYSEGTTTVARISNSIVTDNDVGLANTGGPAILESWGNNAVRGNQMNTSGTITMVGLQ